MFRRALLLLLLCASASSTVTLETTQKYVALHGPGWSYRYGASLNVTAKSVLLDTGDKAWFGRSYWLRLIDTKTGKVLGRWRMPGEILELKPLDGNRVRVTTTLAGYDTRAPKQTVDFDPSSARPRIGFLSFHSLSFAAMEAERIPTNINPFSGIEPLTGRDAAIAARELRHTLDHDSLTPWLQFTYARLLMKAGSEGLANETFQQVLRNADSTFAELLPMSAALERAQLPELSRQYFAAGYRDFILQGRDARLAFSVNSSTALYPLRGSGATSGLERVYSLNPHGMKLWQAAAIERERAGDHESARKWLARAQENTADLEVLGATRGNRKAEIALLFFIATVLALAIFVVSRFMVYGPDLYASDEEAPEFEFLGLSRLPFWSRGERLAILLMVIAAWVTLGYINILAIGAGKSFGSRAGYGSFGAQPTHAWLQSLPASDENQLWQALAADQAGDFATAEGLYRTLPESAVAQNNLGVILARKNDTPGSKAAYERAMRFDPQQAEARWNLTRQSSDYWTDLHERHAPDQPMMAVPYGRSLLLAMLGGKEGERKLLLLGPLGYSRELSPVGFVRGRIPNRWGFWFWKTVAVLILLAAVALNLLPYKRSGRPLKSPRRLSLAVPGVFAKYGAAGALLIWMFSAGLVAVFMRLRWGTIFVWDNSRFNTWMFTQSGISEEIEKLVQQRMEPPVWPAVVLLILLWAANLLWVKRSIKASSKAVAVPG